MGRHSADTSWMCPGDIDQPLPCRNHHIRTQTSQLIFITAHATHKGRFGLTPLIEPQQPACSAPSYQSSIPQHLGTMDAQQNLPRVPNVTFRVLIIGRANAGKTTILQRVCDTTESPKIYRVEPSGNRKLVRSRS